MCFFLLLLLLLCTPFSLSQTVTSLTFTHPPLTTPVCFFSRALHLSRRAHSLRCTYSGCKTLTPLSHTVPSFSSHSRKNTSSAIKHNDSVGVGVGGGAVPAPFCPLPPSPPLKEKQTQDKKKGQRGGGVGGGVVTAPYLPLHPSLPFKKKKKKKENTCKPFTSPQIFLSVSLSFFPLPPQSASF